MHQTAQWPRQFEEIVREHLPDFGDGELGPDVVMADCGLDSLRTVSLLVTLEDTFGVTFPDAMLAGTTFVTVGSLWDVFRQIVADAA